jgi:hypothetical protein
MNLGNPIRRPVASIFYKIGSTYDSCFISNPSRKISILEKLAEAYTYDWPKWTILV